MNPDLIWYLKQYSPAMAALAGAVVFLLVPAAAVALVAGSLLLFAIVYTIWISTVIQRRHEESRSLLHYKVREENVRHQRISRAL